MIARILATVSAGLLAGAVSAAPVTAPGDFAPSAPVVTFEDFAVGTQTAITVGPMTVDAFSWVVRAQSFTQFPGVFDGQYLGQGSQSVTLDFSVDMVAVGFGLLDPNFVQTRLEVFDRAGTLLEIVFPAKGPTGGGFSTYTGVMRSGGDIAQIKILPQAGDFIAVDNIAWEVAPPAIPLPAAAPLMLGGLALLMFLRRERRAV